MSFAFFNDMFHGLGNKNKDGEFSDAVVGVWIQFWLADLLRGLSLKSRDECAKLCMSAWKNDKEIQKSCRMNTSFDGLPERADYIEDMTGKCCKIVIKDKVTAAHLKSLSGYDYSEIGEEIGCSSDFAEELVTKRAGIIERLMKRDSPYCVESGYKEM
ncbi:MAG: hypothetical protein K6G63_05070 [Eubacterium sp.]|nr:hypothetical protein [Eubacterium sp.]